MPAIIAAGLTYQYDVFAAPNPRAIVIGFHGWSESIAKFEGYTKLHQQGAPAVFAFPQGQARFSWLPLPWWYYSWDYMPRSVDVALCAALMRELRSAFGELPVYLVGSSEGASMAYRCAADLPVDGWAAHSAGLNPIVGAFGSKPRLLHIHGDADPIVPFNSYVPSIPAGIEYCRGRGCQATLLMNAGQGHDWWLADTIVILDHFGLPHD